MALLYRGLYLLFHYYFFFLHCLPLYGSSMVSIAVEWRVWLAKEVLMAAANDGMEVMPRNFFLEEELVSMAG